MIILDEHADAASMCGQIGELLAVGATAVRALRQRWNPDNGTPVFTERGRYTTRGWTDWTRGFQHGSSLLLFEATDNGEFLDYGRSGTVRQMTPHLSHFGVHDHGFNTVSTYGALLRLMHEGRIPQNDWERRFYILALKLSGAVQAYRWTNLHNGLGYVYSFNGPHSLFSDTIRSMRSLALSHLLGHKLMTEQDLEISLLGRLLAHAETTARFNVYFGEERDIFDLRGRVAHESIFNTDSGLYRCPSSQQGYSPYSTWTRGLAWILCGYPEQLEFLESVSEEEFEASEYGVHDTLEEVKQRFEQVSRAVADFYIERTPTDGVPYWDTGAPGLVHLGDYLNRPADPFNSAEPVDSSAAAIAAQGLLRFGDYLTRKGDRSGRRYTQAGMTTARTLFAEPYLSTDPAHEGILLHSIYHRPNGWDYTHPGDRIPNGESSMWGDYHALELGIYLKRLADGLTPQCFFSVGVADGVENE